MAYARIEDNVARLCCGRRVRLYVERQTSNVEQAATLVRMALRPGRGQRCPVPPVAGRARLSARCRSSDSGPSPCGPRHRDARHIGGPAEGRALGQASPTSNGGAQDGRVSYCCGRPLGCLMPAACALGHPRSTFDVWRPTRSALRGLTFPWLSTINVVSYLSART